MSDQSFRSEAKIVISSSWRYHNSCWDMQSYLHRREVTNALVIGKTPKSKTVVQQRGEEIESWLKERMATHGQTPKYAIIDDAMPSCFGSISNRLVQTTWFHGMLKEHADALEQMLLG